MQRRKAKRRNRWALNTQDVLILVHVSMSPFLLLRAALQAYCVTAILENLKSETQSGKILFNKWQNQILYPDILTASRFCVLCPGGDITFLQQTAIKPVHCFERRCYLYFPRLFMTQTSLKENGELGQPVPLLANSANIREAHGALSPDSLYLCPLLLSF